MAERPTLKQAVAGQKSKASDYNYNFSELMDFVDASVLESKNYVDSFMPDQTSNAGKFLTTNGTSASWVNVGGNFPYSGYIDGLIITKVDDKSITISAGSCYDNTRTKILILGTATTKQNLSQGASLTYYVYIISNNISTDILISTDSSNPTLPSGYIYYRQIGSYVTDSSNNIEEIYYYGIESSGDKNTSNIISDIMPDYESGITISGKPFVAPTNGYFIADRNLGNVTVNGNYAGRSAQTYSAYSILVPLSKNDSLSWTGSIYQGRFYPVKGVN